MSDVPRVPPNPITPIRETVERVLHETGLADFGRSVSSIDDLTAEVQQVYKRVDDIEQRMEQIVPLLERLVLVAEELEREISPISRLVSKLPGSGIRERRRQRKALARAASPTPWPGEGDGPAGGPRRMVGPTGSGPDER